ncbi:MAG: aldehyde dehydrogenase family protein [Polyangiaceae bacterium]|nr:aldehyde dehydrogenase family protein [Polyangiaceae bacterium]
MTSHGSAQAVPIHRAFVGGEWIETNDLREIRSPYSGDVVALSCEASQALVTRAVEEASLAFETFSRTSRHMRSRLLLAMASGIQDKRSELTSRIVEEAGKPVRLADAEVTRAVTTFTIAAEEAKRFGGEIVPIDIEPTGRAYAPATVYYVPRGPVLAITPFNFPLNLVAHKVAPALAVGAPVLLKPAPQTPGPAALLAQIFSDACRQVSDGVEQVPAAAFQLVSATNDLIGEAVRDPRLHVLSFTGSAAVGVQLQAAALGKRVVLELGGDAAVLVHEDANLQRAAARCAFGAYAFSGQVCISVQRMFVHESVFAKFQEIYLSELQKIKWGDPHDPSTLAGPMIDARAAERVESWVNQAKKGGAHVSTHGAAQGNLLPPALVEDAPPNCLLCTEEAFGPVAVLGRYTNTPSAIELVNRSKYGLQAGIFTNNLTFVRAAVEGLRVGGLLINEVPTYRADNAPYGGTKASGLGREGVRYAMQEYSEARTVIEWIG